MARLRLRLAAPLLLLASPALAFQSDFSFYPTNAQSCLNQASSAANCQGSSAAAVNACLCSNEGGFVTNTAKCLGKSDQTELNKVYGIMLDACTTSGTPLTVSSSDFIAAAKGDTPSTTKATGSSTPTGAEATSATGTGTPAPTPTATGAADNDKQGSGGLSTGATIGIAVGASVVGVAALGALVFFLVRRRKGRAQEEAHPMLSPHEYQHQTPTTFPPVEPSPDFSSRFSGAESKSGAWPPPPYKSPGAYSGPFATPPPDNGVAELPPHDARHGHAAYPYEMDASTVQTQAAEMPGSEPPAQYHMQR